MKNSTIIPARIAALAFAAFLGKGGYELWNAQFWNAFCAGFGALVFMLLSYALMQPDKDQSK